MTYQGFQVHRRLARSDPRQPEAADPRSSPGTVGRRRWSVKVANLIASQYGFTISGKPPGHD
jgi:hypothetical protein